MAAFTGVFISLNDRHKFPASIPATSGLIFLTGKYREVQSIHNGFKAVPGLPPGYFMIATGREGISVKLCAGLLLYMFYDKDSKLAWLST